jgi:hypothetical protein
MYPHNPKVAGSNPARATTSAQTASWPSRSVELRPPADLRPPLASGRGQGRTVSSPSRCLAISALAWAGSRLRSSSRRSSLSRSHVGCTRGGTDGISSRPASSRRKPLEGALDPLKLAPHRGRLPTLREKPDQIARLTLQPEDLGLHVLDAASPLPEGGFDVRVDQLRERRDHRRGHRSSEVRQHGLQALPVIAAAVRADGRTLRCREATPVPAGFVDVQTLSASERLPHHACAAEGAAQEPGQEIGRVCPGRTTPGRPPWTAAETPRRRTPDVAARRTRGRDRRCAARAVPVVSTRQAAVGRAVADSNPDP